MNYSNQTFYNAYPLETGPGVKKSHAGRFERQSKTAKGYHVVSQT